MKMTISADGLTPDDYARSGCDAALAASPRRWKSDYEMAVASQEEAIRAAGDERAAAAILVVLSVISTPEPWSKASAPAEDDPYWTIYEFDDSACAYLSRLLGLDSVGESVITDAEVRARGADLLYQRSIAAGGRRDFRAAKLAVESYLVEAAWQERHDEQWHQAEDRVARAFHIAAELNNGGLRGKVVEHIDAALELYSSPKNPPTADGSPSTTPAPSRYPALLMKLLLHHFKKENSLAHASLAERLAQEGLDAKSWELTREYLGVAALWHEKAGDARGEVADLERSAELWVQEGEHMVARPDVHAIHYAMAEHRLLSGIQALRAVRGAAKARGLAPDKVLRLDERIYEVRWLHQHYQERAVKALVPISESGKFDPSEMFAVVEGKDKVEALFAMTHFPLLTQADVEAMVKEEQETFVLSRYFGLAQLDERGRTTARADGDDIWARACQRAIMLYELRAQCHVGPLLWKVGMDHAVDLADFMSIAQGSIFVPDGREPQYARGLYEGFKGDFALALHLLIPQVENSIRLILRSVAASDEQLRSEHADVLADPEQPFLTKSLYNPWASELARVLGEDVVFALRVLLVERFGANLRNCILHGLIPYGGAQHWRCWYLWWLILKVCCSTAVDATRQQGSEESDGEAE